MKRKSAFYIIISILFVFAIVLVSLTVIVTKKKSVRQIDFVPIEYLVDDSKAEENKNDILPSETIDDESEEEEIKFVFDDIPSYSGKPFVEINDNKPFFGEEQINTNEFEIYSDLDELGRCGVAFANLCPDLMPLEERGLIGNIKPTGWHTVKYNDLIDGNYLYNRCHLIGYQLAGENDNVCNLITGTRYLNVEGMLPFENEVADYILKTGNHVLYRVSPIFLEENLVASGVTIEGYSVEDEGKGICFNVYIYNVQPGIIIDYATGESELDSDHSIHQSNIEAEQTLIENEEYSENPDIDVKYIINIHTGKFHLPFCDGVKEMKEKNKVATNEDREELINQGYSPCKACNP